MEAILNLRYHHSVQHLIIHSEPTIQYIIVAGNTAVMIILKDNIFVTDRSAFYRTKAYTIYSTTVQGEGGFLQEISRVPEAVNTHAQL
jgi:hypothetical protein